MFRKGSILWVVFLSYIYEKSSIVWIVFSKQSSILSINLKKVQFNSLSQVQKKESSSKKKDSILCVILEKQGHFFGSWKKVGSTLWVNLKKSLRHIGKIQFFESCKKVAHMKERFNSLRHFEKTKGFNSLSQNEKKTSTLWVILKRGSKKEVQFCESFVEQKVRFPESLFFFLDTRFNSWSHTEKSIMWLFFLQNWVRSEKGSILVSY